MIISGLCVVASVLKHNAMFSDQVSNKYVSALDTL